MKAYNLCMASKPFFKKNAIPLIINNFSQTKQKNLTKLPDLITSINSKKLVQILEAAKFNVDKTYYQEDEKEGD